MLADAPIWMAIAAVVAIVGLFVAFIQVHADNTHLAHELTAEQKAVQALSTKIDQAQAANSKLTGQVAALAPQRHDQIDVAAVAAQVGPSVFTVDTASDLGSGWVVKSSGGHSFIVTDFHVVAETWNSGQRLVGLRQTGEAFNGTITKVDQGADLALIDVSRALPSLKVVTSPPPIGDAVAAFGSPLDLGGSVTSGIVSAVRKEGIQFTAAISPGNSGGPIVDPSGAVIAVAQLTLDDPHAQTLNFGIPAAVVCSSLGVC